MNDIKEYLKSTKSAVIKIFEAYNSYWELMKEPKRPFFTYWGDIDTDEYRTALNNWREENKDILDERIKRDNEFADESFARATLMSALLQFAFWGIEKYSLNEIVHNDFKDLIKSNSKARNFVLVDCMITFQLV